MPGDPTGATSHSFGVMTESTGLTLRGAFVINPAGQIKLCEIHDDGIGRDAKESLRKIQAAQYVATHPGEVWSVPHDGVAVTSVLNLIRQACSSGSV